MKQKAGAPVLSQRAQTKATTLTVINEMKCVFCEKAHYNHQCEELLKLSATDRYAKAKQAGVFQLSKKRAHDA